MGLNDTPTGERTRIAFFGLRNVGKSSLVNAVTAQELSVVSDVKGTTTDAVAKSMELLPLGPVVIIDTPGIDDEGSLGSLRVQKARQVLRNCDIAVLVSEAGRDLLPAERELCELFETRGIPFVIALNKADIAKIADGNTSKGSGTEAASLAVSALTGQNIDQLKELIAAAAKPDRSEKRLVADLVEPGGMVVLVVPIDESAPKGRIILPQQMAIRDLLDANATCAVCQPAELADLLDRFKQPPNLVVTDSQVFTQVARTVPEDVPLTSFSILMARYRADIDALVEGAHALSDLTDSSRVLIAEGCTHHRQCEDIGTVKMPAWIRAFSGADPQFEFCSGGTFPEDLDGIDLIVHCGACMLNPREMQWRIDAARQAGVPIVNYGVAIAHMNGILERCIAPLCVKLD